MNEMNTRNSFFHPHSTDNNTIPSQLIQAVCVYRDGNLFVPDTHTLVQQRLISVDIWIN